MSVQNASCPPESALSDFGVGPGLLGLEPRSPVIIHAPEVIRVPARGKRQR